MKIIKFYNKITVVFFIGVLFFSCQNNNEIDLPLKNTNRITIDDAITIAENSFFSSGNKTEGHSRKVLTIKSIPDEYDNSDSYFIINYRDGGFLILSGDKRSEPVLAYSENNIFPTDIQLYPTGLVEWLYETKAKVTNLKNETKEPSDFIKQQWKYLERGGDPDLDPDSDPDNIDCDPYSIIKGPYLSTTWSQGCGYNSETPEMTCGGDCGHAWTGCVATAMAQIMKYNEFPSNYSWDLMLNNVSTTTTASLMRDIGNAVNMDYDCDGSGADTEDEVASSLINDFDYSMAVYSDYNHLLIEDELDFQRPVILRGGRKKGWWIFNVYSDGHAWVCDGYHKTIFPCYGSYLSFHLNWGWTNGAFNGYYSYNNFNPSDYTFNYRRGMVYRIKK